MASKVKFTDGTTTLIFDGTDGKTVSYDIKAPEVRALTVSRVTADGEEMVAQAYRDVNEDAEFILLGTASAIRTTVRLLNRLWERVRRYQESPTEDPVYIEVQPEGDSSYWRSILKSVDTDLESKTLDLYLGQGKVVFSISFTRDYFWEAESETELSLYNPGQSKGTGGKTVSPCTDSNGGGADRYNYLDIDNTDLVGDLPAKLRLVMRNTYNSATRNGDYYLGMAFKSDIANLVHQLEGEDTTYGTQIPGSADYSLYSEGYARQLTVTAGGSEVTIGRWDLETANLNAMRSNFFMVYLKHNSITYTDLYLRPKITAVGGLATLWTGPQVKVGQYAEVTCLGAVQLPPIRQIANSPYPEELTITGQRIDGSSGTINIDYIVFMPIDQWRQLVARGFGCDYQVYLNDDGANDRLYTNGWSTAGDLYNYVGYGPHLMVTPVPESSGKHRMFFLWRTNVLGGGISVQRTLSVRAYYRPRRKQI